MSYSNRTPFNPLDRNRYLYEDVNFETRQGSLASFSKVSEIAYEKYNQIILSNILDPKSAGNTAKKQSNYESDIKQLKENNNKSNQGVFNTIKNEETKMLIAKKLEYKIQNQNPVETLEQLRNKVSALTSQNQRLQSALSNQKIESFEERDYQYRVLQNKYNELQNQKSTTTAQLIQIQKHLSEQLKMKDSKLQQSYETIKKMYERNTELNQQIMNLKKQISILQKKYEAQVSQSNKLKSVVNENTEKQNIRKMQILFNDKKLELESNIIKEQELKTQKTVQELNNFYEQRRRKYEDQIRSLKFEISKLKADLTMKSNREKQFQNEIKKHQTILKTKDNYNKEQFKRYEKKIQQLENEKNSMINSLMKSRKQKQQMLEDHKALMSGHRDKLNSLQESHSQRQSQLENKNNELKENNQKLQQKIQKIQNEISKERTKYLNQIQQTEKSHKLQKEILNKNIKQLELNIQNYQSTLKNLRTENANLKQEISNHFKSILMFQDKIKAYQRQIFTLNSGLKSTEGGSQRQYQRKMGNMEHVMNYRKRTERLETSLVDNYQSKERFSLQRKQYEQQIERRRKLNNYPSSNLIKRQSQSGLDMSYDSQYKYNQRSVNVSLPLRRNKMVPRNSLEYNKNLLTEDNINEVMRKCKIIRTHH